MQGEIDDFKAKYDILNGKYESAEEERIQLTTQVNS